jgi:hypothetical protein
MQDLFNLSGKVAIVTGTSRGLGQYDLFNLSGKVAIVTGTSRGLGQYFARALAKAGADLVITSRELSRLTEFKQEIESLGRRALAVQLDVLSQSDIDNMVQMTIKEYGKIDILVNNAGLKKAKHRSYTAGLGHHIGYQSQRQLFLRPGSCQGDDKTKPRRRRVCKTPPSGGQDNKRRFVHLCLRYGGHHSLYRKSGGYPVNDKKSGCGMG